MSLRQAPNRNAQPESGPFRWRVPVAVFGLVAAVLVGAATWKAWPQANEFYTDGQDLRVEAEDAKVRDVLWRNPQRLTGVVNVDGDDYEPEFDEIGDAFYFVRGKTGDDANIFVSNRIGDGWTEPQPLAEINTEYDDLGPRLSRDGLTLYFYSDRPGGLGGYDLWASHRSNRDEAFGEPVNLGPNVNSTWDEYSPAPAPDGDRIFFSSNRRVGEFNEKPKPRWSATLREDRRRTGYDLYVAGVTGAGFGEAESLVGLNSSADDGTPAVSPNGDFVYFSSNRDGGAGGFDLYRARNRGTGFGEIEWLGSSVNGPADELDPVLSMEGFELHFSSNRLADANETTPREPTYDIFRTSSREVFVDSEMLQAEFDWTVCLGILGPALLALLLLLLLLLLSRMLLSSAWRGRLSLIMRCLLASLFVHLLLLTLFMFWQVTTSISGLFDRKGGVRVALASPASDSGLTAQIRGGFAEAAVPTVEPVAFSPAFKHTIQPVRLASTQVKLARSNVSQPINDTQEPNITDSPSSQRPTREQRAQLSPDTLQREQDIALTVPEASQPQRHSESVERLPEFKGAPSSLLRDTSMLAPSIPRIAESADGIARTQLPSSAMQADDSTLTPIKDVAAATLASHKLTSRSMNLSDGSVEHIALPKATQMQPAVMEREQPLPTSNAAIGRQPIRPVNVVRSPPRMLNIADVGVHGRTVELPNVGIPADDSVERLADARPTSRTPTARIGLPQTLDAPEIALPNEASLPATATSENALTVGPNDIAMNVERPALQLGVPTTTRMIPSEILPGSDQPMALPDTIDVADTESLQDAKLATTRRTSLQRIAMTPTSASEFELAPPAVPKPMSTPTPPVNAIGGTVTDAHTGDPIEGATVRLDLSESDAVIENTDVNGEYALTVPQVPDHFAISTSHDGYVPASVDISKDAVRQRSLTVNFRLRRIDLSTVALEAVPDVHHLGDDRFSGSVNSQFQKRSEGGTYSIEFELAELQTAPHMTRCELTMMTRGVQMAHTIYLNGRRTPLRIENSPRDGSFGIYRAEIDMRWLVPGANTFGIKAKSRGNDIDDFEFVNIQLHFKP